MMKSWVGLALSGLMIATLPACTSTAKVASAGEAAPSSAKKLPLLLSSAQSAIQRADSVVAIRDAEAAVALDPARAESRVLLGRAYLAAGRFKSAETAFGDALSLDPALGRIAVTRALAQIALGDRDGALASLELATGKAAEADIGLALALAGHRDEAIERLEIAARGATSTARDRQNLALSYALAGRWQDSAVTASLDVPAEKVAERMQRWTQLAQHEGQPVVQVAMLLGVIPTADEGLPQALALAQPATPVQLASADVAPAPVVEAAAPVAVATAEPVQASTVYATATPRVAIKLPALLREVSAPAKLARLATPRLLARPVAVKAGAMLAVARRPAPVLASGKFVVQLGAFSTARRSEAAWNRIGGRGTYLAAYKPVGSGLQRGSATLHRLALSGFDNRISADKICGKIKAAGGTCFVRAVSGDRPVQWVQRQRADEAA